MILHLWTILTKASLLYRASAQRALSADCFRTHSSRTAIYDEQQTKVVMMLSLAVQCRQVVAYHTTSPAPAPPNTEEALQ